MDEGWTRGALGEDRERPRGGLEEAQGWTRGGLGETQGSTGED